MNHEDIRPGMILKHRKDMGEGENTFMVIFIDHVQRDYIWGHEVGEECKPIKWPRTEWEEWFPCKETMNREKAKKALGV